jgi:predicted TIM-barrel fold metal-dependent hydrolase
MVGIFWRPNPHMGRLMSDRAYDPIYAIAEEHGLNISVHEGIQNRLPWFPENRINTHFAHHSACHPMEQMAASLAMSSGGVFDRFPKLTVSFLESGAGWLPHWLERLDAQVDNPMLNEGYGGKEKPSEYFRRGQGFVSCEAGEEALPAIQRSLGDSVTMWASDYPHRDAMIDFPRGLDILTGVEGVTPDFMKQLLWDNPAKCFNLKV